jgi:ADP-ribose pyrophosphatase YjhB (NUDIX family)
MKIHETVLIAARNDKKFLLIKRNSVKWHGYWAFPGGHVEKNESTAQAAQREANEEVGSGSIKVIGEPFLVLEHSVPEGEKRLPEKHMHRGHCFFAKLTGEIKTAPDEVQEHGWFTKEEAKKLRLTNYTKRVFEVIK